ncbi:MAG: hypothetical protein Q9227_005728 [Pyrenula ochraceoflavens]
MTVGQLAMLGGRKTMIWTGALLITVGDILMMVSTSLGALYAGRLILGIGNGFFMTFSQLYIQECSPAKFRGLGISAFQFWTSIGTLIGTIVDNFTAPITGKNSYLIPLGLVYIVPFFICIGLFFIPESPRWLLHHGKPEQARKALLWLRPEPRTVELEIADIQAAINAEQELAKKASWIDMFKDPVDRRRTMLAVVGVSTQAASGAMFMIAYGTYFFEMAGVGSPFANACILVAVGVVAIIINSFLVTHVGRRRMFLFWGLILCGICQMIIAVLDTTQPAAESSRKGIGMISSYAWLSGGELPSQRLRSHTFGLAAAIGFLGAWLATFTAPYFINPDSLNWGPKYGYIWFPSCFVTAAFIFFFFPEVKGRTLEEIDEMFEARLPARKFRKYVCVGRGAVDKVESNETREVVWGNEKAAAEATINTA